LNDKCINLPAVFSALLLYHCRRWTSFNFPPIPVWILAATTTTILSTTVGSTQFVHH